MAQPKFVARYRRWLAGMLAILVGLGPLATPGYAALTLLADQPLSVQNLAKPNIMLTVDDSTSMLYDFLPDEAILKYCRDATGNMNALCGVYDTNTDLTLIGHGRYETGGYVYEQFGFPFPAYDSRFDTSGPGAGCGNLTSLPNSTCSGGIDPGPLPGIERYPGPPGPLMSPKAGQPYEYWTLWPAPVHNTELNHAYYNPRLTYEPPVNADGSSYPQMNAADTVNWTQVPADPWAPTVQYVDLTRQVTIGLWCNSDWSQGLENDPRYCRTNGVGPTATSSSASSVDGDYGYPWAPPGIDPTAGSSTALSIAYAKVNSTTHALLAAWSTAADPKYYYENDNIIWCNSTSPLWPDYGPLQTQTCSNPAPTYTAQTCQGVTDQTCGGGTPQTCVGATTQSCNNAQPQTCGTLTPQTCVNPQPQTCTGQQPQNCAGGGTQTCDNVTAQTCNGAVSPTCDNVTSQSCNGAITQSCGGITGQTCDGATTQICAGIAPQACNNVQAQSCNAVSEVCNLPDPASCPVVWNYPYCPCTGSECSDCQLITNCPPGACSITGGQCQSNGDCPGARQCSISHNACNVTADCAPLAGTCAVLGNACLTSADCANLGQCNVALNQCQTNADCPLLPGVCSINHNNCSSASDCPATGQCTNSHVACTTDGNCPNTMGTCSVVPTGCMVASDCPNEGQCSNTALACAGPGQCPAVAGTCSIDGNPCFDDGQCGAEGHCSIVGNICTSSGGCPTQPGQCTITATACFNNGQCLDANGQCTVTHAACVVNGDCPTVPGACNQDAMSCLVNGDCAPSSQCSLTNAVCHSDSECPVVNGTCSSVPTACADASQCPAIAGHCSSQTTLACGVDSDCPVAGNTCSVTGENCSGSSYSPYCDLTTTPPSTCTEPAYCPRQGGTCSVDNSPCFHNFDPPNNDNVYCNGITTPGACSLDGNTCTYDGMCPPKPSASSGAVCSDLVSGSATAIVTVPNGNFETPFIANYQYGPGGATWNWGPGSGIQRYPGAFGAYPSTDLWQTAFIQGAGSFSQSINLNPGSYRISFTAATRPANSPAGTFQPIVVSVDGVPLGSPIVPTPDFQFNTFAFGFSIAAAGPHTITFAGTDSSGDKTTFIDLVAITSGMSLLEDANGAGLVCRHNNKAYSTVAAAPYNYPDATYNTPVTAGTGPNSCTSSPRYANVPRHYYKTGVQWCDKQIATAGDKWLGYGTPVGGTCQDASDSTHMFPRFYQFGQDPTTDNYATPAFQRIDLDITQRATATYTHAWTDSSGDSQIITRTFDGATPDVSEMTNYANWFAYYRTRIQAVKTVTSLAFVELNNTYRVGFHNLFNLASFINIADFDAAQKTAWFAQLFGVQIPLGQQTPSLTALMRIGQYYQFGTQAQLAGSTDPIELACQKNWHMFFTDGYTNQSGLPTTLVGDQDSVVPALPEPVIGLTTGAAWPAPYAEDPINPASNSLSDYAMYYWVTDLRPTGPQSTDTVPTSTKDPASWQHQNFAAISLGTSGKLNSGNPSATLAALTGGSLQWPKPYPTVYQPDNSGVDDLWHAAVNGRGSFVNAQSADEVKLGIGQILAEITNQAGVRAGVGLQNINFGPNANYIYQAGFDPDWGGSLTKLQIDPVTSLTVAQAWNAAAQLDAQLLVTAAAPTPWLTQRRIVTMNETGTVVPFLWANLGAHQQDSLAPGKPAARGQTIMDFLRGNRAQEGTALNQMRLRTTVLGDIADSGVVYVGPPNSPYQEATDPGYSTFLSTFASRAARVYVGANDGMVHAFDDSTGSETWAYVPSVLYRGGTAGGDPKTGLGALSYQDGALPPFVHHFYVDATAKVTDVNFAADTAGQDWRTILVGGLGKGGAAYYALDITDPSAIVTEADAVTKVLWEFKPSDMGYSYGKPIITKTRAFNGAWLVIVATGYDNPSGVGQVYFVRARDGVLLKTMSTGVGTPGTPSGLAHLAGYTKNFHNQLAEQIYGGDLLGNFWRFDVSDPDPNNWTVGQLASLVDGVGAAQPVTTPPQIEIDITNDIDRWVFVGTGKLYDPSDLTNTQIETMYAIRDGTQDAPWALPSPPVSRASTGMVPLTHAAANDFGLATKPDKGWFDDLPAGQQMVVAPEAAVSIVAYFGTSPQTDPCLTGLQATLYARSYANGQSLLTDSDSGALIPGMLFAQGGVGVQIVVPETPVDGAFNVQIVVTAATKIPPIPVTPKLPPAAVAHRMSWRLLGQ